MNRQKLIPLLLLSIWVKPLPVAASDGAPTPPAWEPSACQESKKKKECLITEKKRLELVGLYLRFIRLHRGKFPPSSFSALERISQQPCEIAIAGDSTSPRAEENVFRLFPTNKKRSHSFGSHPPLGSFVLIVKEVPLTSENLTRLTGVVNTVVAGLGLSPDRNSALLNAIQKDILSEFALKNGAGSDFVYRKNLIEFLRKKEELSLSEYKSYQSVLKLILAGKKVEASEDPRADVVRSLDALIESLYDLRRDPVAGINPKETTRLLEDATNLSVRMNY